MCGDGGGGAPGCWSWREKVVMGVLVSEGEGEETLDEGRRVCANALGLHVPGVSKNLNPRVRAPCASSWVRKIREWRGSAIHAYA